jgi:hypothetical protein
MASVVPADIVVLTMGLRIFVILATALLWLLLNAGLALGKKSEK